MSKLPEENRFLDLSDYGRPAARWIVRVLEPTPVSSIHLTFAFLVAGLLGIWFVAEGLYLLAAAFLILKNILDAADGEMARVRGRPSQTGRYLDSVFDFLINLGLFWVVYLVTGAPAALFVAAFLGIEFQGTIFNYYYLVQRRICSGDTTSQINEFRKPTPFGYENPRIVRALHVGYLACYGLFDWIMLRTDRGVLRVEPLPNWFMTLVSSMGLGIQLLLMAVFIVAGKVDWILPFFLWYTGLGLAIIVVRKAFVRR